MQPLPASLKPNPAWASLPLFDRTGWKRVRFGDVVKNCAETCDPEEAGLERFVAMEHLEPGSLHVRSWGNVADGTTFTRRCRPGQVLFGKRRAYQRKVAVADFEAVVSGDIYVLAPKDTQRLLPELLPFLCLSERFFQHAVGTSAGSLSPRTNWSSLASFEFDLPPLDQQRRIAEILWAVDEVIQSQRNLEQSAIALRMNLLRETFKDRHDYPKCRVDEVGDVQLGQQRHPKFQTGESSRPYLRVANVMDDYFDYSDVMSMDFAEGELGKFALEPGDILLNEGQSLELVGRCAMYDGAIPGCCFQKTLLRFRAFEEVSNEWALGYFQFCQHFGVFASISSQTTSVAHLTAVRFKALQFPKPPLHVQEEFSDRYRSIRGMLQKLRKHSDSIKAVHTGLLNEWSKYYELH
jgi:type I restriction enzyme S subunit